jgi:hypothetical protein
MRVPDSSKNRRRMSPTAPRLRSTSWSASAIAQLPFSWTEPPDPGAGLRKKSSPLSRPD